MKRKQIDKHIDIAIRNINKRISDHRERGGIFAKGVAGEGYNGGYRDALYDVQLLLNGVVPNRSEIWKELSDANNT